jgi:hypothetical protein
MNFSLYLGLGPAASVIAIAGAGGIGQLSIYDSIK